MDIHISKQSEVPLRQQLAEQIVFLIATEKLKAGEVLPSVRALARRLKIHHNTVSEAYQDLVQRAWLARRRGSRLTVRAPGWQADISQPRGLDGLINATIRMAREQGFSLQALRQRVRERLLEEPPDHFLVVEEEAGLRSLLIAEIRKGVGWPAQGCSRAQLAANPGLAIGALTVAAHFAIPDVDPLLPRHRPAIPLAYGPADQHVELVRSLARPSVIAVVSVSKVFLKTASSLLAAVVQPRHTLCEVIFPLRDAKVIRSADKVFCDTLAFELLKGPRVIHYQLLSQASLEYLRSAISTDSQVIAPASGALRTPSRAARMGRSGAKGRRVS